MYEFFALTSAPSELTVILDGWTSMGDSHGRTDGERSLKFSFLPAFRIHLILTWIRIRILGSTFGKSGSGSSDPPFRNSGSGSSDPHLEKVDPDPVPKWIRIRNAGRNITFVCLSYRLSHINCPMSTDKWYQLFRQELWKI